MFEEFVSKRVLILKTDGYKKVGLLVELYDSNGRQYLKLQHDDGRIEYIAFDAIQSICEGR